MTTKQPTERYPVSTKSPTKVKRDAEEMPYFSHTSWRRYMGRGVPRGASRSRSPSYYEACLVIWNEWSDQPDIERWAQEFGWPREAVEQFVEEMRSNGEFDRPHPILGVRS